MGFAGQACRRFRGHVFATMRENHADMVLSTQRGRISGIPRNILPVMTKIDIYANQHAQYYAN